MPSVTRNNELNRNSHLSVIRYNVQNLRDRPAASLVGCEFWIGKQNPFEWNL